MASKAKLIGSTEPMQTETAAEEREGLLDQTREQEIRNRAYEIYLQRGEQPAMNWAIGFRPKESSRNDSPKSKEETSWNSLENSSRESLRNTRPLRQAE